MHLDNTATQIPHSIRVMSDFGERTRPRARGSAPSLNPLPDVSDEGVADHTRGRVCSPKNLVNGGQCQDAPNASRDASEGLHFDGERI